MLTPPKLGDFDIAILSLVSKRATHGYALVQELHRQPFPLNLVASPVFTMLCVDLKDMSLCTDRLARARKTLTDRFTL